MGEFILPDGSRVWLNEESRLAYDADFSGRVREVTLSGEAFFEVESDLLRRSASTWEEGDRGAGHFVRRDRIYADPARQVIAKAAPSASPAKGFRVLSWLCPDQKFTQNVLQGEFSAGRCTELPSGSRSLVFYNMPLTDIMVNLERKYHVEIVLSSSLPANKRLSLVVQHEPLEDIMEVISRLMPVRCQIDGDRVFVTNQQNPDKLTAKKPNNKPSNYE